MDQTFIGNEWVNKGLLLNAKMNNYSAFTWRKQVTFWWWWWWYPLCTRVRLSSICKVLAHFNNSPRVDMHVAHLKTYYSYSKPTSLCSYPFVLPVFSANQQALNWWSLAWPDCCSNPRFTALVASSITIKSLMRSIGNAFYMWVQRSVVFILSRKVVYFK